MLHHANPPPFLTSAFAACFFVASAEPQVFPFNCNDKCKQCGDVLVLESHDLHDDKKMLEFLISGLVKPEQAQLCSARMEEYEGRSTVYVHTPKDKGSVKPLAEPMVKGMAKKHEIYPELKLDTTGKALTSAMNTLEHATFGKTCKTIIHLDFALNVTDVNFADGRGELKRIHFPYTHKDVNTNLSWTLMSVVFKAYVCPNAVESPSPEAEKQRKEKEMFVMHKEMCESMVNIGVVS